MEVAKEEFKEVASDNPLGLRVFTNTLKPSKLDLYLFARMMDMRIRKFLEDPENQKAYEAWKKKKREKEKAYGSHIDVNTAEVVRAHCTGQKDS